MSCLTHPLMVVCPKCGAWAGFSCKTPSGKLVKTHKVRLQALSEWNSFNWNR